MPGIEGDGQGDVTNPYGSFLEQKLVIAWKRWERAPESRDLVLEIQLLMEAFCEDTDVQPTDLYKFITNLRRNGIGIENAVRLGVVRLING